MNELLITLRLSVQRALLGMIKPNIRTIYAGISNETIVIKYIFDGQITEDDMIRCSITSTEIIADFDSFYQLDEHILRIDYPEILQIPDNMTCVFLRNEVLSN